MLSYIDVRHANFLPPSLTVSKARDLSPKYTTTEDLAPVIDESAERVSLSCKVHIPVGEPEAQGQAVKPEAAEANQEADMVTRRKMIADRFLPSTRPMTQPQQPQGKDQTPPSPPTGRAKKRHRVTDQQTGLPISALSKTPPRISIGIVIREPVGNFRQTPQNGTDVVSSSQLKVIWQPTFKLGDGPLPACASVSTWSYSQGGQSPRAWCTVSYCLRT